MHPQPQRFHQAKPSPIQHARHQGLHSIQLLQHGPYLLHAHHHRQPRACSSPHHPLQIQIALQQLPIQKQQRRQCLVLRRSAHLTLHRQVREKGVHLSAAHLPRMA